MYLNATEAQRSSRLEIGGRRYGVASVVGAYRPDNWSLKLLTIVRLRSQTPVPITFLRVRLTDRQDRTPARIFAR